MSQSQENVKQTLLSVLQPGKKYKIPNYQRHFTWGVQEATELFEDIESSEQNMLNFLGTMIFQEEKDEGFKVVDGQQRLTTLTLLIIAIRNRATNLNTDESKRMAGMMSSYVIFSDPISGAVSGYRIIPSKKVEKLFNHIADPKWDTYATDEERYPEKLLGNQIKRQIKKIKPIFQFFINQLEKYDFQSLQKFSSKVLNSFFYIFHVSTPEESMQLFERINARGMRLEVSDLIKTYLFTSLNNSNEIEQKWNHVEEIAGESPTKLLKNFYYTQNGHVTKKKLFSQIKKLNISETELLNRICDFASFWKIADVYNNNANDAKENLCNYLETNKESSWFTENETKLLELQSSLISIKSFGVTQHIPLVYGILSSALKIHTQKDDKDCLNILLKLCTNLEHFHFANTAICNRGGNEVENLYAEFSHKFTELSYEADCSKEKFRKIASELNTKLKELIVTEGIFVESFSDLEYEVNSPEIGLMFYAFDRLNNFGITFNQELPKIYRPSETKVKRKIYTIEHIFPQNPDNNYAPTAVTKVHNIGNLVILAQGDNTKLSNKMPKEKFDLLKNNLKNTQNLSIVKELIDNYSDKAATWNDETIAERAKSLGTALYGKILKIRDV